MPHTKPLAIVIPWFGKDLKGGAEQQAYQVAMRLAARGTTMEVLTTCCRSFHDDWSTNHLVAGTSEEQGVIIRRFPVDARHAVAFDRINAELLGQSPADLRPGVNPLPLSDSDIFVKENINSSALLDHLRTRQEDYQAFIFIPYLFGPTLQGLPVVADRAFLQPCLHDEVYAYLPLVEEIFRRARGLLFNSEGEAQLAMRLYGPGIFSRTIVVGEGIEVMQLSDEQIEEALPAGLRGERFILYLGRRDATKKTDFLVKAYARFKETSPHSRLKLVLAGPGDISFAHSVAGVIDLGLVEEDEKAALLKHCLALFQPSRHESFSRVIMEAWSYGRPVAAHRECPATALAVERAQGGWIANTEVEWVNLFAEVDFLDADQLMNLGANGRAYADQHANWDQVIERYQGVLGLTKSHLPVSKPPCPMTTIHQLLPDLAYGDAVSNQAIAIRDHLRSRGYESEIFVKRFDERVAQEAKEFNSSLISEDAGLLYHHSIGSELTTFAINHPGPKCLIYHNITPAEFFTPYRPGFAWMLEMGRNNLRRLGQHFALSVGDSAYNAAELAGCNFHHPGVLPIIVNPDKWNITPDADLMRNLQDGKANLLYVGRIAPNKRQDQLVEAFSDYLTLDSHARLIIVGDGKASDPYYRHVINAISTLGLSDQIRLTGQVNDAQLLAYYRTAHLFWSMSEHEGFCVPVVEAMWFDVPVLAYESAAVPETLGGAGVTFTEKNDLMQVAALAHRLVRDINLRGEILAAQNRRRVDFLPQAVWLNLDRIVEQMEESVGSQPWTVGRAKL